jgi:predicted ATP-dependent protease
MSPSLSVVADNDLRAAAPAKLETPKPETVAERVRRLQAEARQLAKDHIHAFTAAMSDLERMAAEIAEGGEAYPAGVRDLARRFVDDCEARVQTLEAITARA